MNFNLNIIYQLRDKKNWWVDVVFYFVISSLLATIICYVIFAIQIYIQNEKIKEVQVALTTVGTEQQKEMEKKVFEYQEKINDFSILINEHKITSNIFGFIEQYTLPNVWFSRFSIDEKQLAIVLSGETDDLETISRQVSTFEATEYVKKIDILNSQKGTQQKINFNISLSLDSKIFTFEPAALKEPAAPQSGASLSPRSQGEAGAPEGREAENTAAQEPVKSSEKLITHFNILLTPAFVGSVNQVDRTIVTNVPFGTDITNLRPLIIVSQKSSVMPASNVPQNFSEAVIYTVTAEDGSAQNYVATVNVSPSDTAKSVKFGTNNIILIISIIAAVFVVILTIFLFLLKKIKRKK